VDGDKASTIDKIKEERIIKISSLKGRAKQMNAGASIAKGNILLFLHADTVLPSKAFSLIYKACEDKKIKAGAFDLAFLSNSFALKIIAKTASLRSRLTHLPYGDQAIFIKKEIFEEIGTYENIALMEDIKLMQELKKRKYKIVLFKAPVLTSARKWEDKGILYTTLRNWLFLSLYFIGVDTKNLAKYYK